MRALFVDANDSLAEVTERLLRPGDPAVSIHRDPDIAATDLPRLLAGYSIAIDDHTQFPTEIVRQCPDLKHIVFLGTGARSYMNPEEAGGARRPGPHHQGLWRHRRRRDGLRPALGRGAADRDDGCGGPRQ
ncbi:hypothetical protein [Dankookia sp. P2]|uniref:hypothetical protein n=1 Tax=Dankookia sp. P2 TaxID=3423955 RepID=UPI003D66CB2E